MAPKAQESGNIAVAVRVRPFNSREISVKTTCCVEMPTDTTVVFTHTGAHEEHKNFEFDYAYWSHDPNTPGRFTTQETIFEDLGNTIMNNAFDGYNACLFAYGQTGSGKTWSVLGGDTPDTRGLLPRVIEGMFIRMDDSKKDNPDITYQCRTSYLEIYNEQLRDLLMPPGESQKLEIRQHPKLGIYVPGLTETPVANYLEVKKLQEFGAKCRSVAATSMNDRSSRSHCVFVFEMVCKKGKQQLFSKVNLVDLAGSERQKRTQAEGDRLKEGAMINQSLTNLAIVINKLAEAQTKKKGDFVPFRNSKLTYLLSESLSGNSKTVMMAAISPAADSYDESMSTLRFAQSVKAIKTRAVKNEESSGATVDMLKAEVAKLKEMLGGGGSGGAGGGEHVDVLKQQLQESEALAAKLQKSYEETVVEAQAMEDLRKNALDDMGLSFSEIEEAYGVKQNTPHLMNLSEDPSLNGCLLYFLPEGENVTFGADEKCKVKMKGLGVQPFMCCISNVDNSEVHISMLDEEGNEISGDAKVKPRVVLNGYPLKKAKQEMLHHDRLIIGRAFCFRVVIPQHVEEGKVTDQATDADNLQSALGEVIQDESPEFDQCCAYVEEMTKRIGHTKGQQFLRRFSKLLPSVEEANEITREVRPRDRLRFSVEVISDIFSYETDEPELVVRVWQGQIGINRLRGVIQRKLMGKKLNFKALLKSIESTAGQDRGDADEQVLHVWEVHTFLERIRSMRDIYEVIKMEGKDAWDFRQPGSDPWMDITYLDMRELLGHVDRKMMEHEEKTRSSRPMFQHSGTRSSLSMSDGERSRLATELESSERTRERLETQVAERDRKILKLENEIATLKASTSESLSKWNATSTFKPAPRGMLESKLKNAGEESLAAAHLASQLLSQLQEMKEDLQEENKQIETLRREMCSD